MMLCDIVNNRGAAGRGEQLERRHHDNKDAPVNRQSISDRVRYRMCGWTPLESRSVRSASCIQSLIDLFRPHSPFYDENTSSNTSPSFFERARFRWHSCGCLLSLVCSAVGRATRGRSILKSASEMRNRQKLVDQRQQHFRKSLLIIVVSVFEILSFLLSRSRGGVTHRRTCP